MSWVAAAVGAVGIGTSIYGSIKAHNEQKKLENAQSPTYTPSQSIADYYQKALQRYSVNPYQSAAYQQQLQNVQQSQANSLNSLQGRREGLAGVGAVTANSNNALLGATGAADQRQGQALGQLGEAAGAQTGQQQTAFNINQQQPFERNFNLLAMKAAGANQLANAGFQTAFSGATNAGKNLALSNYFNGQKDSDDGSQTDLGGASGNYLYAKQPVQLSGYNPYQTNPYQLQQPQTGR